MKLSFAVETDIVRRPFLITLYGTPGIGKTTFGSKLPKPIILCAESGADQLRVAKRKVVSSSDIISKLKELKEAEHDFETIVIDSLDALENIIHKEVCDRETVRVITDLAFGAGYAKALAIWKEIIAAIFEARERLNICLIAHSMSKSFNDPTKPLPYDRYTMKLNQKVSDLIFEGCDAVMFSDAEAKVLEQKGSDKGKIYEKGKHRIWTVPIPGAIAKSRYALPPVLDLDGELFIKLFNEAHAPEGELDNLKSSVNTLISLMPESPQKIKAKQAMDGCKIADDFRKLKERLEQLTKK